MNARTIATIVDLGIFFILIFGFNCPFLPALLVSVAAGFITRKALGD